MGRLERRGVRRLRELVRARRCSGDEGGIAAGDVGGGTIPADQAVTLGGLSATGPGGGVTRLLGARELKGSSGSHSELVEVKSERESSGGEPPKAAPPTARAEPPESRPPGAIVTRDGADLTLPLLSLLAVVALLLAARAVRRSGTV